VTFPLGAYDLRAAVAGDAEFLYATKSLALRDAVIATFGGWDETWQHEKFFANFVPSTCHVVLVGGREAGMLAVDRDADPVYVGGIYLMPEFQRRGLGTAIMRDIMREATRSRRDVHLQVLVGNPDAKRFYERLGFETTERTSSHFQMRWQVGRVDGP
jgi:ribosomal protein S18 acetylase RimI-like enzyme